jgi:hypothetical protein
LRVETNLRLEAVSRRAFDARLARLGGGRLTRAGAVTYFQSDGGIEDATYQLALAGIRVARCSTVPGPASGLRPAIGLDLVPLGDAFQAVDVVELRQIPLSDASAALMRRRLSWLRTSRVARNACLRLLREEDAVLGWRRIVWCSVASMRAVRARVRLRPVVFDRTAVEHHPLRWTYVSDGAIERWAFT